MKALRYLVMGAAAILLLVSCELFDSSRSVEFVAESSSGLVSGNYHVTSDILIRTFFEEPSPRSFVIEGKRGDLAMLTVSGEGTLHARIFVNGNLFKEETGTTIVQAAGSLD